MCAVPPASTEYDRCKTIMEHKNHSNNRGKSPRHGSPRHEDDLEQRKSVSVGCGRQGDEGFGSVHGERRRQPQATRAAAEFWATSLSVNVAATQEVSLSRM